MDECVFSQSIQYPSAEVHKLLSAEYHDSRKERENDRMRLCRRVAKGRRSVSRLEELMQTREAEFKDELQRNIKTISKNTMEIAYLTACLKFKEEEKKAALQHNKDQVDRMKEKLEAEREAASELRKEMLEASLESQEAASLQKDTQLRLDLANQQLEQRNQHILDLRKEKQSLTQRLMDTTAKLWQAKIDLLQENSSKEMGLSDEMRTSTDDESQQRKEEQADQSQDLPARVKEMEKDNGDLVEEQQKLTTIVEELDKETAVLIKTEQALKNRLNELEVNTNKIVQNKSFNSAFHETRTLNSQLDKNEESLIARVDQLEKEKNELEPCLAQKEKKKGLFGRFFRRKTEEKKEKEREEKEKEENKRREKERKRSKSCFWKFWKWGDEENEEEETRSSDIGQQ